MDDLSGFWTRASTTRICHKSVVEIYYGEYLVCRIIQRKRKGSPDIVFGLDDSIENAPDRLTVDLDDFLECVQMARERLAEAKT